MSTIAGIVMPVGEPVSHRALHAMVRAGGGRVADAVEVAVERRVGLAHAAHHTTPESHLRSQPLVSADGSLRITADVRLDARSELARALGFDCVAVSDAELILAAYEKWGPDCVDHLHGDFAFGLWDERRGRVFCARDVVGCRPLHYHYSADGTFYFASTARQVLAVPGVSEDLDGIALCDWLTANFRFHTRSAFAAVQMLPPGHALSFGERPPRIERFWHPERSKVLGLKTDEDYIQGFRSLLRSAVSDRLHGTSPAVAMLTSGGLDSSSIAAVAQDLFRRGERAMRPIAFVESFETYMGSDERAFSDPLIDSLALDSERIDVEAMTALESDLPETLEADHPAQVGDGLTHGLFERVRSRDCGVLTLGLGGDSLFDGARLAYVGHLRRGQLGKWAQWARAARRSGASRRGTFWTFGILPLLTRGGLRRIDRWASQGRYWHLPVWITESAARQGRSESRRGQQVLSRYFDDPARQRQYVDIVGLAQQGPILASWEFHAARNGVEMRYPLLDRRLAEFVLGAPLDLGARPGPTQTKWLLRRAMDGSWPDKIANRADKGSWGPYLRGVLIGQYRETFQRLFTSSRLEDLGLIRSDRLLDAYRGLTPDGPTRGISLFYCALYAELWLRNHVPAGARVKFSELASWQRESD